MSDVAPGTGSTDAGVHPRPLAGLRVCDLTRVLAGPYCTMILADLGADVVKVEQPGRGDDSRHFGPFLPSGESAYFASLNRGKRSITLDLSSNDGQHTLRQFVERADVLVENFRPGTMARFGLDENSLAALNPRLIYAALSGFGRSGKGSNRPAYDIVIQAMSGLMSITGTGPDVPVRVGTSICDILTGLYGAIAIVAAIENRHRTGKGTSIDLSMLDCTVAAMENAISRFAVTGDIPVPLGTRHPSITPFQAVPTQDEPIVIAAGNDNLWRKLCGVLGCPELADDPLIATNNDRTINHDYLESQLNPRFQQRTRADWLGLLDEAGIPAAPIRNMEDVIQDEQLALRGMIHSMNCSDGSQLLTAGSPLRMNGAAPPISDRAPGLGEHTARVLAEWLSTD